MTLLLGDCLEKLKDLADNSVDSIVTDPPYGLSFMGKAWDYDVPSQDIWAECLRVLKPGGHLLAFFGTRTYHRGACRIEDAGFEIRDQIMWIYGSGFPKSHNLKEEWKGWGTALKPANEPIVVARKPLEKGLTIAENVLKWGTGALNIDGSRIECESRPARDARVRTTESQFGAMGGSKAIGETSQGRWPANVILDEEAAKVLDEQSGISKSTKGKKGVISSDGSHDGYKRPSHNSWVDTERGFSDSGGASRFFYVAKASKKERNAGLEELPHVKSQSTGWSGESMPLRQDGSERKMPENQNFHPTVKPKKLMGYLCNLVTPPGGVVLDPFMGSGSTGVAAKEAGFNFIGIERDPSYFGIASKRIESAQEAEAIKAEDEDQLEFSNG